MPKAISYIRFSSAIQGDGSSTARQEARIGEWLGANPDYELSNLSAKDLGRSAYDGEHLKHGLGEIIRAIKEKRIVRHDVILVEAFDRLGRLPPTKMITLIQEIIVEGVKIITLEDQQVYSEERLNSDSSALYILIGKVQQAHDYSKRLGKLVAGSYEKRRIDARNGVKIKIASPFWLNSDGSIKIEHGNAVRECVELYLKGKGTRRVLLELYGKHPVLEKVHPSTLKRWFSNKALIGEWSNKGDPIKDVFDSLIDENTFYALQRQLQYKSIKKSPEVKHFLGGLVVCSKCGGNFHYRRKEYNGYVIKYGNCSRYLKRGPVHCDNNKTWPYEVLYYIFNRTYRNCLLNIKAGSMMSAAKKELQIYVQKEDELTKRINKYVSNFGEETRIKEVVATISRLELERTELQEKIAKLRADNNNDEIKSVSGSQLNEFLFSGSIKEDETQFQELLRKNNFSINVDGAKASVDYVVSEARKKNSLFRVYKGLNDMLSSEYELFKRSTRYNCYILKETIRYRSNVNSNHSDSDTVVSYCAVFRDNNVERSQSEIGLYNRLDNPGLPKEETNERPWMVRFVTEAMYKN